jgi:hypothetical protein
MSQVWERLDVSGGELVLALSIADFANDAGESIFPSVKTLCEKTRQSRATVQRQMAHFREVNWLQVVGQGGLSGGRERTTEYRINPDWVKGLNLTQFPDVVREENPEVNSLNVRPFENKGPHPAQERASPEGVKGLTAMSHDPSGSTINLRAPEDPRATPTGSRVSALPELTEADHAAQRYWWNFTVNTLLGSASALGICPFGTLRLDGLPENARAPMSDVVREIVADAMLFERQYGPLTLLKRKDRETEIVGRVNREIKPFIPAPASSRSSAAV